MENEVKICGYRNCNKKIDDKDVRAKYCSRLHKEYEKKYRNILKIRLEREMGKSEIRIISEEDFFEKKC